MGIQLGIIGYGGMGGFHHRNASKIEGVQVVGAYDIDPVAVRVAKENAEKNGVSDRIECGVSDLLSGVNREKAPYMLVTANIVADILIRMAPDIAAFMGRGARLIASGIIESRKQDVLAAMEAGGLHCLEENGEKDWCVLVFER